MPNSAELLAAIHEMTSRSSRRRQGGAGISMWVSDGYYSNYAQDCLAPLVARLVLIEHDPDARADFIDLLDALAGKDGVPPQRLGAVEIVVSELPRNGLSITEQETIERFEHRLLSFRSAGRHFDALSTVSVEAGTPTASDLPDVLHELTSRSKQRRAKVAESMPSWIRGDWFSPPVRRVLAPIIGWAVLIEEDRGIRFDLLDALDALAETDSISVESLELVLTELPRHDISSAEQESITALDRKRCEYRSRTERLGQDPER